MTLDPQIITLLGSVALAALTYLYNAATGRKHASLSDQIDGFVDQAIHVAVVEADSNIDTIRIHVTGYVWLALAKAGVPRSGIVETLVTAAIEQAIGKALEVARAHDRSVEVAIAANVSIIKAELAKPAPVPIDLPKILDGVDVTILPRDGTEAFKPVGGQ